MRRLLLGVTLGASLLASAAFAQEAQTPAAPPPNCIAPDAALKFFQEKGLSPSNAKMLDDGTLLVRYKNTEAGEWAIFALVTAKDSTKAVCLLDHGKFDPEHDPDDDPAHGTIGYNH